MLTLSSTRNFDINKPFVHAISNAQPEDGGLWFRKELPKLTQKNIDTFVKAIRSVTKTGDENTIRLIIKNIFLDLRSKFDTGLSLVEIQNTVIKLDNFISPLIVPIIEIDKSKGLYLIDETTGPTNAFKDLALQMLTAMMSQIISKKNEQAMIKAKDGVKSQTISFVISQTSTSGDTGPAGGAGIQGEKFIINTIGFPAREVTYVQAGQMLELKNNVLALPMKEAFTKIQESMKEGNTLKYRNELKKIIINNLQNIIKKYSLLVDVAAGSFNSVNVARIDGQSIYHIVAFLIAKSKGLVKANGIIESVPSGNFGHSFGILQAKHIVKNGIAKIIISTNENDAIYRLIRKGRYKIADAEVSCPSVSMVIRYGSNVERLFAFAFGDKKTKELMEKFKKGEELILTKSQHKKILDLGFIAYKVNIEDELITIRNVWLRFDKLICPHTANAYFAAEQYQKEFPKDDRNILINETASAWKFLASIATALSIENKSDMKKVYQQYLELERTKEGVQELLMIIEESYLKYNKEFDINIVPSNLYKIFNTKYTSNQSFPARQFQEKTKEFLSKYASKFKSQIRQL